MHVSFPLRMFTGYESRLIWNVIQGSANIFYIFLFSLRIILHSSNLICSMSSAGICLQSFKMFAQFPIKIHTHKYKTHMHAYVDAIGCVEISLKIELEKKTHGNIMYRRSLPFPKHNILLSFRMRIQFRFH